MFQVIRGGCFTRHPSGFVMNRLAGLPHYLLLLIKTEAKLYLRDTMQTVIPNSILIIPPNTPYTYSNPKGEYIDDWLHFTCDSDDIFLLPEHICHRAHPTGISGHLTTYIQQILWEENFSPAESKGEYVDALFRILLKHIQDEFRIGAIDEYNPYRYKLQQLRLEIQAAPYKKNSAPDIAAQVGISTSYFQYLYKLFFGIPFHTDVINMRIDYAKELIIYSDMPLEQIAYASGYAGEVHFYRQFLSKTGMTPGEYRRNHSPQRQYLHQI